MARGKKGRASVVTTQAPVETQRTESVRKEPRVRGRFSILDYVFVCIFFIAFCYLQKYVAIKFLAGPEMLEKMSLDFFFDTLWKGFIIIVILVGLHDFFYQSVEEEESP